MSDQDDLGADHDVTLHDVLTTLHGATDYRGDVAAQETVQRYLDATAPAPADDDDQDDDQDDEAGDGDDQGDRPTPAAATPAQKAVAKRAAAKRTAPRK